MNPSKIESSKWLERYIGQTEGISIHIDSARIRHIRDFLFLYAIYERIVIRNKNAVIPEANTICEVFEFFQSRYLSCGEINDRFNYLRINNNKRRIISTLKNGTTILEKQSICRTIVARFRNNLFHGNKRGADFWNQTELFNVANSFLMASIEANS